MFEVGEPAVHNGLKVVGGTSTLAVVSLAFVFHPLTPSLPQVGLDASWVAAMGEAAQRPLRWGIDVAFTYGPASPLVTGYLNAQWTTHTIPLEVGFSLLFGWCTALLVADRPITRAAAGTAACGLMLASARSTPDAFFLALPLLVLLLAVRRKPERSHSLPLLAGAFALGVTAMVKMSFPLAAVPMLALADLLTVIRRRELPLLVLVFGLGVLSGALLYGQRLTDFPAYLLMQGEVVQGYAAAMALDGPLWDLLFFLTTASALLLITVLSDWRTAEGRVVSVGLAVSILFLFKAGFIRHDLHSVIAWTGLSLIGTVLAWARLSPRVALAVTTAACLVVLVYEPAMTVRQSMRHGRADALARIYRDWFWEGPSRQLGALTAVWTDPSEFRAALDDAKLEAWRQIAKDRPLPPLPDGVDIISSDQTRVMAAGLDYRGRPSFQEYSTYTASLAAANRAFIEGPHAPRWILFGPDTPLGSLVIDGRFPSMAEGPLWPDLLALYRPKRRIGSLVALERRSVPAVVSFGPPLARTTTFDTVMSVAATAHVWATIEVRLNIAGRALSALFRPPLLTMHVKLDDGTDQRFRLVPELASGGFLLSPLVVNASDYLALAAAAPVGKGRRVTEVAVETSRAGRLFYDPQVTVTLRTLGVVDDEGGPTLPAVSDFPGDHARVLEGAGLASLPISNLPVVHGRRHVAFDYGSGLDTDRHEACFAIHPADGTRSTLWQRCLEPDTGPARVTVSVPDRVEELALEIRCGEAGCKAPWMGITPDMGVTP